MAFVQLNEYNEGSLPECGVAIPYHYCSNAMSYKPIDVSGLSAAISQEFQTANDNIVNVQESITNQIKMLGEEWGTKFAAIDGKDLGIVDANSFGDRLSQVTSGVTDQQSKCEAIVSTIVSKTAEINSYLAELEQIYQEYKQHEAERNSFMEERNAIVGQIHNSTDQNTIASLSSQVSSLDSKIDNLNRLLDSYVDIHEPDGSWVLG